MEFSEVIEKPRVDNVKLRKFSVPFTGTTSGALAITSHHFLFQPTEQETSQHELSTLHRNVDQCNVEMRGLGGMLTVYCKNFLVFQIEFESLDDCMAIQRTVETLSRLDDLSLQYPLWWNCSWPILEDGWTAFSVENEFARLQLVSSAWRLSHVNKDYAVCQTYPEVVIVPATIDNSTLIASAKFRQFGRFPVLSYFHKNTRSSIVRCSQPLVGPSNRRCRDDETLLKAMLPPNRKGYIVDTRAPNVVPNFKAKGGGSEPDGHYAQWKRVHRSIQHFTQMQEALMKQVEASTVTDPNRYWSKIGSAGWLLAVQEVLTCAAVVAQSIDNDGQVTDMSVVVHGTEGFDSTLQVTSLAQIILDPDARTIRGFESLIVREWLFGGHPFATRCRQSGYGRPTGVEGATFLCFLDCVFQLHKQYRFSFEFNEEFLLLLFDNAYAPEYGTFLCNSDKERRDAGLSGKTTSLWSHINRPEIMTDYMNPLYEPNNSAIWPSVASQSIVVWERLFHRFSKDWEQDNIVKRETIELVARQKQLTSSVSKMRRQLLDLVKESASATNGVAPVCS